MQTARFAIALAVLGSLGMTGCQSVGGPGSQVSQVGHAPAAIAQQTPHPTSYAEQQVAYQELESYSPGVASDSGCGCQSCQSGAVGTGIAGHGGLLNRLRYGHGEGCGCHECGLLRGRLGGALCRCHLLGHGRLAGLLGGRCQGCGLLRGGLCGRCGLMGIFGGRCRGCGSGETPHTTPFMGPAGPPAPTYGYPYYTTRGPRDFLMANPPALGY